MSVPIYNTRLRHAVILIAILLLTFLIRVPFLYEPIDRDSGGYAYVGRELASGLIPYRDIWDHKPPGIHFIYALIYQLFGNSTVGIRAFAALWAVANAFVIYRLGKLFYGRRGGYAAALLFAVFSGGPVLQGSDANTEPFMILFTSLAIYSFLCSERRKSSLLLLACGFLAGIAFEVKQVAIMDFGAILLCLALMVRRERQVKVLTTKFFILSAGFILAQLPFFIFFLLKGALNDFIFCAFAYNLKYASAAYEPDFLRRLVFGTLGIMKENSILWLMSFASVIHILANVSRKGRMDDNFFLPLWAGFCFLGVSAGGRFFPHYYIQLIPPLCLLAGYGFSMLSCFLTDPLVFLQDFKNCILTTFLICCLAFTFSTDYPYYFVYTPDEVSMHKHGDNPFVEARKLAVYLRGNTEKDDYIFVWGKEPEIYFLAGRRCASRYKDFYPLKREFYQFPGASELLIADLKRNKPKYIITQFSLKTSLKELDDMLENLYSFEATVCVVRNNRHPSHIYIYRLNRDSY